MKPLRYIALILTIIFVDSSFAQQTTMYNQYTFNKAGMNPAAAGTEINQGLYYACGLNRQWLGFENSPKQNFVNISYTIRPPRSYRHWQNAGLYFDTDKTTIISNENVYAGYAFHLLLTKTTLASFGVYAGLRSFRRSIGGAFDPNDPAVVKNRTSIINYPDIIPGFRLANKKFFLDISVRQITVTKLQDHRGRRIGSPSLLQPSVYFDYGRKIPLSDFVLMMPSFAVNLPVIGPPLIDYNVMFFYANTIGAGVGLRNLSSANASVQIRFYKKLTIGMSYTYPLGNARYVAQNSFEVMVGVIPIGMNTKVAGKHSIAKCPTLSY